MDADFLVTAQRQHQIDVVGPPFGSYGWQHQIGQGYDLQAFVIDWEAAQAHCPQGQTSVKRIFPLPFWRIPLKMKELVYFSCYDVVM